MKIRAKKGYNIVLNDLNVALSSNGKTIEVDEEKFNLSTDAKQLQKFIEIIDTESNIDVNAKSIKSNSISINKAADNAFVVGNPIPNNPIPNKAINESSVSNETNETNEPINQPSQKIEKTNNTYIVKTKGEKTINNAVVTDVNNESKQLVKKAKINKNSQNKESEPVKNESIKNESVKNESIKNESIKKIDENTNKK